MRVQQLMRLGASLQVARFTAWAEAVHAGAEGEIWVPVADFALWWVTDASNVTRAIAELVAVGAWEPIQGNASVGYRVLPLPGVTT